jgi:hypothetical protein
MHQMTRLLGTATVAGVLAAVLTPVTAQATVGTAFEQDQRVNSLVMQFTTDTFATKNALGGAFVGGTAQSQINTSLHDSVQDGSISWILEMLDLDDLTGTSDPSLEVGLVEGTPVSPVGDGQYDGTSDLDWWYTPSGADIDEVGNPDDQLPASMTAKVLTAGPGATSLTTALIGVPVTLDIRQLNVQATAGDAAATLESTDGGPPGYLPEENPASSSFGSMTGGRLRGDVSAASLAAASVPAALQGATLTSCSKAYTSANTMLDLLVGGCTISVVGTQIQATQPDEATTPGDVYTFQTDATTKAVNGCTKNSAPAVLSDCLAAAEYSLYFTFTTDRVIVRSPCAPGSYSATGRAPCVLADAGFYVAEAGSTSQTACATGFTSPAGATSCDLRITTTTLTCARSSLPVGVSTLCTATVTESAGPTPTGPVTWAHPANAGTFSAASCQLSGAGTSASCSVSYRPSYAGLGSQKLRASYGGDDGHASSSGVKTLTATKRASRTRVACSPTKVPHGTKTICVAKVTDVSPGTARTATGHVNWSAPTKAGVLSATSCKLAGTTLVRKCKVTFTTRKKFRGDARITARYGGDAYHFGSTGRRTITVV